MSSVAEKPSQVLREALALMDGGKKWIQGDYENCDGFCARGAMRAVTGNLFGEDEYLPRAVGTHLVSYWNDKAAHFSVIEQGFQKAIELAESEGK